MRNLQVQLRKFLGHNSSHFEPFIELSKFKKAERFDKAVKRILTRADIDVGRELDDEQEVEALHASWIYVSIICLCIGFLYFPYLPLNLFRSLCSARSAWSS